LLKTKVVGAIVQDCPPELYACEVCGHLKCDNQKWVECERRLRGVRFLQTGQSRATEDLIESPCCPHYSKQV
jgi:hypothetical protein